MWISFVLSHPTSMLFFIIQLFIITLLFFYYMAISQIGIPAVNLCSMSVFSNSADKQRDLDPEFDEAEVTRLNIFNSVF